MSAAAYTPAAMTALDEIVANLVALAQGVARDVAGWGPAVFDELDAAGDLDAWDALECEIREAAGEQLDPAEPMDASNTTDTAQAAPVTCPPLPGLQRPQPLRMRGRPPRAWGAAPPRPRRPGARHAGLVTRHGLEAPDRASASW